MDVNGVESSKKSRTVLALMSEKNLTGLIRMNKFE